MKKSILVTYCLVLAFFQLYSQHLPYYYAANNVKVYNDQGRKLSFPFAGGLKHPLFGLLDLNNDGYKDLIILDRMDDRILTYINRGIKDSIGFVYKSQFELELPDSLSKTVIIKDYNNDGKPDLFAFASSKGAGIVVYKNISSQFNIAFDVVANPLKASFYGNPESDIYVSSADIPAIADMDGDGDLDILTFSIIQGYVEFYKNLSRELFQNSENLKFKLVDDCWGRFMEGDQNNHINLNITPDFCYVIDNINHIISKTGTDKLLSGTSRHAGSTFMAGDMDNDGDVDIVLGDVQYPGLILLTNGKNEFSNKRDTIIRYDTNFPKGTKAVHVRQMPGVFYIDLNNDSINDMVVSPMDKDLPDTIDGSSQIWMYKNLGTNKNPKFSFIQNDFLQNEMIDLGGATQPVFFDYDQDGDDDLFIATTGSYSETLHKHDRIVLYENTGTPVKPEYRLKNPDFSGLASKNYRALTLAFGDVDGDQKKDMILGKMDGTLSFYRNVSKAGDTANFRWVTDFVDSIDVGNYSCPYVFDINADNYGDLFVGEDRGEISYFLNSAKGSNPEFKLISPSFAGITFKSLNHFTTPVICDLNNNGRPELIFAHNYYNPLYGKVIGEIGYVEDIDDDTSRNYTIQYNRFKDAYTDKTVTRHPGLLLRPAFNDLDGDGYPDMMLGSSRGGLMLLTTKRDTASLGFEEHIKRLNYNLKVYPNPAKDELNINLNGLTGNYNLQIIDFSGKVIISKTIPSDKEVRINTSLFLPGFYILKLSDNRSEIKFYKKVIIQ